nr:MAG TPA: hypothetical protein [Caudoviricetes sp.]
MLYRNSPNLLTRWGKRRLKYCIYRFPQVSTNL